MTYQSFHFRLWVETHARLFETRRGQILYLPYSRVDMESTPTFHGFVVGRDPWAFI